MSSGLPRAVMEDSVEWCWHGVAVQGKCPFKRPAVKGGVIIEMD